MVILGILMNYISAHEIGQSWCPWMKNNYISIWKLFTFPLVKKAEEPEIKLPTLTGSERKQRNSRKKHPPLLNHYTKAFDCVDHNKLWKARKEMGIPHHLTCLLRNLYAGQEATVRILYGTTDWFRIEKGVRQSCLLSSVYLTYMLSTSWEKLC